MAVKRMSEIRVDARNLFRRRKDHPGFQRAVFIELLRVTTSEFMATFMFVAAVLAAIVNNGRSSAAETVGPLGVGLAVALAGTAVVYAFGDISGAMFNPAITFGFVLVGKMSILRGLCYWIAQLSGAIAAAGVMYLVFPNDLTGAPSITSMIPLSVPLSVSPQEALFMEAFLAFNLVYVVFAVAVDRIAVPTPQPTYLPTTTDVLKERKSEEREGVEKGLSQVPSHKSQLLRPKSGRFTPGVQTVDESKGEVIQEHGLVDVQAVDLAIKDTLQPPRQRYSMKNSFIQVISNNGITKRDWAALCIGFTLGFDAFLGASVTGGGFNPARALGAAIVANNYNSIYVYIVGPLVGGALAALFHTFIFAFEGAAFSAIPEGKQIREILDREQQRDRTTTTGLQEEHDNHQGNAHATTISTPNPNTTTTSPVRL